MTTRIVDDFGRRGRSYRKTDVECADLEAVIMDVLERPEPGPGCRFTTAEKWSEDVSGDVAYELRRRCDLQQRDVPFYLEDCVERYEA